MGTWEVGSQKDQRKAKDYGGFFFIYLFIYFVGLFVLAVQKQMKEQKIRGREKQGKARKMTWL